MKIMLLLLTLVLASESFSQSNSGSGDFPGNIGFHGSGDVLTDFSSDTWCFTDLDLETCNAFTQSLAFHSGLPAFSYWTVDERIMYAEYDGTVWTADTVVSDCNHHSYLQFLSDGTPCIATAPAGYLCTNTYLTFLESNGADWVPTYIYDYDVQHPARRLEMRIDSNDMPHIVADLVGSTTQVVYSVFDGDSWETKDDFQYTPGSGTGAYPGIALDNENEPHIIYNAQYHAFFEDDLWWYETLAMMSGSPSARKAIACDSDGAPHVIYVSSGGGLYHAWDAGPGWLTELIDDEFWYDEPSICIAPNGDIHAAFRETGNQDLCYAFNDGSGWTVSHIDWDGYIGFCPYIALDDLGNPCIVYLEHESGDYFLRMAWFMDPVGIENHEVELYSTEIQTHLWPNPAFGSIQIEYTLPTTIGVDVQVFDLAGHLVRNLEFPQQAAGTVQVLLDDFSPGMYILRISAGSSTDTQRFIILK